MKWFLSKEYEVKSHKRTRTGFVQYNTASATLYV